MDNQFISVSDTSNMHVHKILSIFRLFALEPFVGGSKWRIKNVLLAMHSLLSINLSIVLLVHTLSYFLDQSVLVFDVAFVCKITVLLCAHMIIIVEVNSKCTINYIILF